MFLKEVLKIFILTTVVHIPSTCGFHLTSNTLSIKGVQPPRQSQKFPNKRKTGGVQLEVIWGPSSSSTSDNDSPSNGEEIEETEKTSEDETIVKSPKSSDDAEDSTQSSTGNIGNEKSLLALVNDIGNNFKSMAQKAVANGYQCEQQNKKIGFAVKACVYYTLFIIYRSYRGFFVLLPATFREVYKKMDAAMAKDLTLSDDVEDATSSTSKFRTKITVSILTTVITISYVVGGILKMASKFVRTIAKTSDVPKSFGAAADEVMNFEGRMNRVAKIDTETSGLTP